ncbi:myeloid leukemia factor 1 isoform X2 [Neltuma alba]|uniref:myeloid leukemia factor 1 isoform X2 n=1 Tax=Neltuma alba TaxID=207710 RepID=UPI0010A348D2|nr:myeloid leukemia factor 1 isoform X2 [Prosopis alba]XP_028754177.1 myeloid leukemia factor 1 isoform X2 [Prosopis alba]
MQRRRESGEKMSESRNSFNGFGDIGGFGSHRSMLSNLFGGRDPFDDPFFTRPFDSIFGPTSSAPRTMQNMNEDKGVIIRELDSDDEGDLNGDGERKYSRSTMEPSVEHPDDDVDERKLKQVTHRNDHNRVEPPKTGNFSYQTSKVTYGGVDGAYYTSTRTRKTGADGVVLEESKEADKTTGQATHRISRGIHDKGHSFTRRLNSDGKIDSMQTLHNLNEDELSGFEERWKGNNTGHFPGWKDGHGTQWNDSSGHGPTENRMWRNWSCPSLEQGGSSRGFVSRNETSTGGRTKRVVRINIE